MSEKVIPDSVCVMSPVYRDVNYHFFESLCLLLSAGVPPHKMVYKGIYGDSLVSRARNIGSAIFLEPEGIVTETVKRASGPSFPKCEWLLWLDSDLEFRPNDVKLLLDANKPLIGGLYSKKKLGGAWVANTLKAGDVVPDSGLFEVRYIGTGFMLIHRSVFEKMIDAYPELYYKDDCDTARFGFHRNRWDFWTVGLKTYIDGDGSETTRYLSEDWYFCERWKELGGEVWAHCDVKLTHYGEIGYPITPYIDGCEMGEINDIMQQALARGETETAAALQDALEVGLHERKKLGSEPPAIPQKS